LLYVPLSASPARADRVDDFVREQMRLRHVPGLALAVVRDGRVVKESGYGLASVELEVPVDSSTVFEIGSISKQITAAAVMMLVEEGEVSLNDPISKYIAESPGSWRGVTIGKLKLAGKNMSRLVTQIGRRLAAELSVMEKQGVWKPAITEPMALQPPWVS
jgi:CubicO group peptidase (beta-lactamase class C family)